MKFCIDCGQKLEENSTKCRNCGKDYGQAAPQEDLQDQDSTVVLETQAPDTPTMESPSQIQEENNVSWQTGPGTQGFAPEDQYSPIVSTPHYESDQPYSPPPFGYGDNANMPGGSHTENVVVTGLKHLGSSPLMIIACVFLSLVVLVSGVVAVLGFLSFDISDTIDEIYDIAIENINLDEWDELIEEFSDFFDVSGSPTDRIDSAFESIRSAVDSFGNIIGWTVFALNMLPVVFLALILLGMWLHVGASLSKVPNKMSTSGLTIVKTMTILQLIGYILVPVGFLTSYFVLSKTFAESIDGGLLLGVFIIVLITILLFIALPVIYSIEIIRTVNTVKKTIKTGIASKKVSGFVSTFNIIMGVFYIFSALIAMLAKVEVLGLIITLSNAGFYLLTGIAIKKYKNKMQDLAYMAAPIF